ncbi:hypothetical protein [Clostridium tagluense]|uniref:Uncharacterized protein n=1 Tax=Clostridium tagluense TaxID=360422 RepID=A0A401UST8_9CLOT|nr:hypothetical protein [Clostridium tagluense]GCD12613.1 hypothetical protein Ctaglu_42360 [Clostridium tagluense]
MLSENQIAILKNEIILKELFLKNPTKKYKYYIFKNGCCGEISKVSKYQDNK